MILCVGTTGSAKSVLLRMLQTKDSSAKSVLSSIPTVGTNLVQLTKTRRKKNQTLPPDVVTIREVGGKMAPLWHSYIEPGRTKGDVVKLGIS